MTTSTIRVQGLDCPDCARKLVDKLNATPGVVEVELNFLLGKVIVSHNSSAGELLSVLQRSGHPGTIIDDETPFQDNTTHLRLLFIKAISVAALFALGLLWHPYFLVATMAGGAYLTFFKGFQAVRSKQIDMNVLMSLAILGALLIGEWSEGALVALLFAVSNWLEARNMDWTRRSVQSLMEIAPQNATVITSKGRLTKKVKQIVRGELILVKPGERIPLDGVVENGESSVDQSAISGESLPVPKSPGETVFAGTLNQLGVLEMRVTKESQETTLSRIVALVEKSQGEKTPTEAFVNRFARHYTPVILGLAIIIGVVVPALLQVEFYPWIYRGLSLLVIGCPCALILATPVTNLAALGNAARHGILIKGGVHLEKAANLNYLALDKTGTLTYNRPKVVDLRILHPDLDRQKVLEVAYSLESLSEHPLARAVVSYSESTIGGDLPQAEKLQTFLGKGIEAKFKGEQFYMGSVQFISELHQLPKEVSSLMNTGRSLVVLASQEKVWAVFAIEDEVRISAKQLVQHLKELEINVAILTGDNQPAAERVRDQLGIAQVFAELLPEDKLEVLAKLQRSGTVAMIGDGINDAPALAKADLGIAMGAAGSSTALETADVVFMGDNLSVFHHLVTLGKQTMTVLKQNIGLALGLKLLALALIVPGWLTLWMAVVADMGSSLLVTINGMRLVNFQPKNGKILKLRGFFHKWS